MAMSEQQVFHDFGYNITHLIGSGSQANVYKATVTEIGDDKNMNEEVVLKSFCTPQSRMFFQAEMHFLSLAQGHANIIRLVDCIDYTPNIYALALELCDEDLYAFTERRCFLEGEAADVMEGVLFALEHIHRLEIVHRDIKPENILLARDGSVRVTDFGVAAWMFDTREMSKFRGSIEYMAAEVLLGQSYGPRVDIFAFGATFYFLLGRKLAFDTKKDVDRRLVALTRFCKPSFRGIMYHVSRDSKQMILWCTHPDADWRPDASFALTCPPFATWIGSEGETLFSTFESQLLTRVD